MLVYTNRQMQKILFIIKHNKSFLQQKENNYKSGVSPSLSSSKAIEDTPYFIISADKKRYYERILYPWML